MHSALDGSGSPGYHNCYNIHSVVAALAVKEAAWGLARYAVISSPRPGSVRFKRNNASSIQDDVESEITGRVVGTVR